MKKTVLEIYALAVCFFTVACFVVTLGIALFDVIQVANPEFTLDRYRFEAFQSNESYKDWPGARLSDEERKTITEEKLTEHRATRYAQVLRAERHDGAQSLLRMIIIMFVDALAFIVHWIIAKRARQSGA